MKNMKNVKKKLAALLALCLLFPVQAGADVIVVPEGSFYQRHERECEPLSRWYQANGEPGYASLCDQPGGMVLANIENGTELYLTFSYSGRGQWGYTELDSSQEGVVSAQPGGIYGWINLSTLRPCYDSIAFRERHAQEITPFSGDASAVFTAKRVYLWKYPGAPPVEEAYLEDAGDICFEDGYTDPSGLLWGRVGYYRGWRDIWVCISDPENADLPVIAPEQPPLYPAAAPPVPSGYRPLLLAAMLVAFVLLLTLFLLRRFWKKKG